MTFAQSHYAFNVPGVRAREARWIRRVLAEANAERRHLNMLGHMADALESGFARF